MILQYSQLCQQGDERRHIRISEQQRLQLCGQYLCWPFLSAILVTKVEEGARAKMVTLYKMGAVYCNNDVPVLHKYILVFQLYAP